MPSFPFDRRTLLARAASLFAGPAPSRAAPVPRLGFAVLPSRANFVFARHPTWGGAEFAAALREHEALVRHFNKPRTAPYLRITVGPDDDTHQLIAAAADTPGDQLR
jgi:histidinol-phosphate/aromatic aminotransferase/cobyric acid decarboxylase-like protein